MENSTYFGKNREARLVKLKETKLLVCLSDEFVDEFSKRLDYPKSQIRVVGHTVEVTPLKAAKQFQKTVGILCRIENRIKRLDRFLLVAKSMPDYQFHIYGTGSDAESIQKASAPIGNVTFHGVTSDIASAFEDIAILLVTSDFEGFGITIIEALSQATPVVIGKNSFSRARDLIADNENGFVCEDFSVQNVEQRIRDISANYERFSANALKSFDKYDNATFVRQWASIFDELEGNAFGTAKPDIA